VSPDVVALSRANVRLKVLSLDPTMVRGLTTETVDALVARTDRLELHWSLRSSALRSSSLRLLARAKVVRTEWPWTDCGHTRAMVADLTVTAKSLEVLQISRINFAMIMANRVGALFVSMLTKTGCHELLLRGECLKDPLIVPFARWVVEAHPTVRVVLEVVDFDLDSEVLRACACACRTLLAHRGGGDGDGDGTPADRVEVQIAEHLMVPAKDCLPRLAALQPEVHRLWQWAAGAAV
jgi:hypothetical protein